MIIYIIVALTSVPAITATDLQFSMPSELPISYVKSIHGIPFAVQPPVSHSYLHSSSHGNQLHQSEMCGTVKCGRNAKCANVRLNGKLLPICECLPGKIGDPYIMCKTGTGIYGIPCQKNDDCSSATSCYAKRCRDPCEYVCPSNSCIVRNHAPICN